MLDKKKWLQYGLPRSIDDIQGITIHETRNYDKTIDDYINYYANESKEDTCFHYIVDDRTIIQLMPDDYMVHHTGMYNDFGDKYTIAIVICSNLNDSKFNDSVELTVGLINRLLETYSIDKSNVFFHRDFNIHIYDPRRLLDEFETSRNFIYRKL